ncbi:GNAT family N-acetyltransferase [Mesobacillus subterraneus]|uniref:GNAT family N-acetyltransferase n=1 Tax=Mesobacillus subterraneus TaxID=285983 RepID=UPI001CFD2016|nr:GNAT family N-acetyltransferase [Mesobacillus subterraneus]WLR53634.1 GNAT family N-acetyltransferase [Mesobacillus subterraneus]
MVILTWRRFESSDLPFFQDVISASDEWRKNELKGLSIEEYIEQYDDMSGEWRVWEKEGDPVAVSFHVESAHSNQKPWLGTILIMAEERRRGFASQIISHLGGEFKVYGQKALFAAVPIDEYEWSNFLSDCGFEQYKTEENKGETYLIMVRPLE